MPALAVHVAVRVVVTALLWRDLAARPAGGVRGGRNLWRLLPAPNTTGSLAYLLVGLRR